MGKNFTTSSKVVFVDSMSRSTKRFDVKLIMIINVKKRGGEGRRKEERNLDN